MNLLSEWQTRLGLQDWVIKLNDNCKPNDMMLEDVAGCVEWVEPDKIARIDIIDPQYYGDRVVPFDYEKTLVHELLHLKTSLVSDKVSDLQARYMHQMIDDLAKAFVDAKRYGADMRGEDEHPDDDDYCSCGGGRIMNMTLRQLIEWAMAHDYDLDKPLRFQMEWTDWVKENLPKEETLYMPIVGVQQYDWGTIFTMAETERWEDE